MDSRLKTAGMTVRVLLQSSTSFNCDFTMRNGRQLGPSEIATRHRLTASGRAWHRDYKFLIVYTRWKDDIVRWERRWQLSKAKLARAQSILIRRQKVLSKNCISEG